jgi:hypothetical protein
MKHKMILWMWTYMYITGEYPTPTLVPQPPCVGRPEPGLLCDPVHGAEYAPMIVIM